MNSSVPESATSHLYSFRPKHSRFWRLHGLPLTCLSLSLILIGLVRIQTIPVLTLNGAPVDETYHFGRVIDTITLLNRWGLGSGGDQLQAEFQQANPTYGSLDQTPYSLFNDYWQSIGIYLIQAVVQLAAPGLSLVERLYLARFVNTCCVVILVNLAYLATARALQNRGIALATAGVLGFVPTLSTSAASVTTEILAFVACLLIFNGLVDLYKNGWSGKVILWLFAGILSCLFTKNTSWPVIGIVIFMVLRRASVPGLVFLAGALLVSLGAVTQFQPQGAAHWYREHLPLEAWEGYDTWLAPIDNQTSYLGHNSLILMGVASERPLIQHISDSTATRLQGQSVTIGSWVHAPAGTLILLPVLQQTSDEGSFVSFAEAEVTLTASGDWQFAQYHVLLPVRLNHIRIALWQIPGPQAPIQYDGLVMVADDFPEGSQPNFSDNAATDGVWNKQPFVNLLQNGSIEDQWWGVDSARWTIEFPVNQRLFAWQDNRRTTSAYFTAARSIFTTLWGSLQNDVPGSTRWQIAAIGLVLAMGLGGCLFYWIRPAHISPGQSSLTTWVIECWFVWLAIYLTMGLARADISGAWVNPYFYASGRFIIPVLFPLAGLALSGLSKLMSKFRRNWMLASLVALVFLLNTWMLLKVERPYYDCSAAPRWSCIASLY